MVCLLEFRGCPLQCRLEAEHSPAHGGTQIEEEHLSECQRHQGKLNIAFCDGHVETRDVTTTDLQSVYQLTP